jgi:hypothetical protein
MTTDTLDPFALARQEADDLRPDEQELLQAYRILTPEKADAAVRIMVVLAREPDRHTADHKPSEPPKLPRNKAGTDRLRAAAEELAAAYRAPLPEGDAGLIAAVSRWCELEPMHSFESRGFSYTLEDEREIITPISTAAEHEFENRIEAWPVQGLAGAAAKLRYLFENRESIDIEDIEGRQLIAVIEREAGGAQL